MKSKYALYSQKELKENRKQGLKLSDEENDNFYKPIEGNNITLSSVEFEKFMDDKGYSNHTRNYHRKLFTGIIHVNEYGFDHLNHDFPKEKYTSKLLKNKLNLFGEVYEEVVDQDIKDGEVIFMSFHEVKEHKPFAALKIGENNYKNLEGHRIYNDTSSNLSGSKKRYLLFKKCTNK